MGGSDELVHEANILADDLRRCRALPRAYRAMHIGEISTMESRLTALWVRIRAARAPVLDPALSAPGRRTRPKWE